MQVIDLNGPEGNVFVILGYAKSYLNQFEDCGMAKGPVVETLKYVLDNYRNMQYQEILDKLKTTELFKFRDDEDE